MDTTLLDPAVFFAKLPFLDEEAIYRFVQQWHARGETKEELLRYIRYVEGKQEELLPDRVQCVDCSGTGGDGSNTLNISTAAAFVASALGVNIAKHGARKTAGSSGSIDVLEALGINLVTEPAKLRENLRTHHLAFISSKMSAELFTKVKKAVQKHKTSSFLSFVGPLTNPLRPEKQLIGVGKEEWLDTIAGLAQKMEKQRVLLVHGHDKEKGLRLDELSVCSATTVVELTKNTGGQYSVQKYEIRPSDLGIKAYDVKGLQGGSPQDNARKIRSLFSNPTEGALLDAVSLNAGAILYLDDKAGSIEEGYNLAKGAIQDRAVQDAFLAFLNDNKKSTNLAV